jgi:hypothetical protein
VFPLQQPLGHEVASQTHWPVVLLHSWPAAHAPHAAPPLPHDVFDSDAYVSQAPLGPPLQQPAGHVSASHVHVPFVVSQSPFPQTPHAAPPVPHTDDDSEA